MKYKARKSQISMEFLISISIIFVIFIAISIIFSIEREKETADIEENLNAISECIRISNIVAGINVAGDGAEASVRTDYLVTFFNYSMLSIESIKEIEEKGNKIAFLASEAGPTKLSFYNEINAEFNPDPDWYKTCFSDLDGSGCSWGNTSWMESKIPKNISALISNLNNYTTIYLEDSTIQYTADYISKLSEWVAKGNVLVLSEHVMCREQSSGSYSNISYQCNPPGSYNNDNWNIFNATLYQRGDAAGWPGCWNNNVTNESEIYNLNLGENLIFEEKSYVKGFNASNFNVIGRYRIGSFKCGGGPWLNLGDSAGNPSIAYWDYGNGRIFYFGDFEVEMTGKEFSTDVLAELIEKAYYLITPKNVETMCPFYAKSPYSRVTGDLRIKNRDNIVIIESMENITQS